MHTVRYVRRIVPIGECDGPHAANVVRFRSRRNARRGAPKQHAWMCLSCYFCTVRCPMGIRIPDVMYGIKSIATHAGVAPERNGADFSSTFVSNIHRYGRSYEMGLVARHYLRHYPLRLPGLAGMGLSMVAHRTNGVRAPPDQARRWPARDPSARGRARERGERVSSYLYYPGCSLEGQRSRLRLVPGGRSSRRWVSSSTRLTIGTAAARRNI